MSFPRALVLRAAGINCEQETKTACERAGFWADVHHVNRLVERTELLHNYHLLVVPGGFSYGDDLGAGKILGNEIAARLGEELRGFVRDGKLVLGICNGFQVLVRAGLLPDPFSPGPNRVALAANDSGRYEDRWVYLKICSPKSEFLKEEEVIQLPVAHGEGKFVCRSPEVLTKLEAGGQVVLRYVDRDGGEAGYPWNPNGSAGGVAGICDPTGRVFGLMPHPERFQDAVNHPQWVRKGKDLRPDGLLVFRNACEYVKGRLI
ncbi:MAG: phosphoribosylformylglycinamidine synthase I [Planctomycetes bacterium]|nr:phosphoribosylformylglycinamidine synthase I [Planctomycetota bacterium]